VERIVVRKGEWGDIDTRRDRKTIVCYLPCQRITLVNRASRSRPTASKQLNFAILSKI